MDEDKQVVGCHVIPQHEDKKKVEPGRCDQQEAAPAACPDGKQSAPGISSTHNVFNQPQGGNAYGATFNWENVCRAIFDPL